MISKKKIALVTGGAGFIGSHMVDLLLDKGFYVRVIDNLISGKEENLNDHKNNDRLSLEIKDINNLNNSSHIFSDVDYVYHFAGIGDIVPSIEKPIHYINNNILGTSKILECCKLYNIKKLIYAASSSCYGMANVPTNEKHTISPMYPYALSKYIGEQICFHWWNVYNLPVNSMRIFNAYGIRSKTTGTYGAVFGVFLKQKISNQPFTLVGDGTQKRDFVYASDVANAFYLSSITNKIGQIYNVGSNNPQTINYLIELLGGGKINYLPKRPGEPVCTWAETSKINKDLNWYPKITFKEGVNKIISEINYWKDAPLWNKNNINKETKNWFNYL